MERESVPEVEWTDPVQVHEMWQATCDSCGWHSPPAEPHSTVREWARLHRATCPLRKLPAEQTDDTKGQR